MSGVFRVTLTARLRHAELYAAARSVGGNAALARLLGVYPSQLGHWVNLQSSPYSIRDESRRLGIEAKLLELTGKSLEELFPEAAREFLGDFRPIEVTRGLGHEQLARLAARSPIALGIEHRPDVDLSVAIRAGLATLSARYREAVCRRYGLEGHAPHDLDEVGAALRVTRERARQIIMKAERLLLASSRRTGLMDAATAALGLADDDEG